VGGEKMVKAICAFVAFFMLPLVFAATEPVQKFINSSFEPDQQVETRLLSAPGAYYLVIAGGNETYVVDGEAGKAVKDRQELRELLEADSKSRSNYSAILEASFGLDEEILAAKEKNEKKCMQYLGLDMHPCNDKESCTVACFAVPQCSGGPLYSDGFLEAFMDWNADRQEFDSLLRAYAESQEAMANDTAVIESKVSILESLHPLSKKLSANPIFLNRSDEGCSGGGVARCYEYCPKVDYSTAKIDAGKRQLQALKSAIADLQSQALRAGGILNRSEENDRYLASRGGDYEEFRLKMHNDLKRLAASAANLSLKVDDPEVEAMLVSLSNFSSEIAANASAGLYRKALSQRPLWASKSAEAENRIAAGASKRTNLDSEFRSIEAMISGGALLLGEQSASKYREELAALQANASGRIRLEELSYLKSSADSLKARLAEEIAAKATNTAENESAGTAPKEVAANMPANMPASLPCLPGFVLLALLFGGVFWGRRKEAFK